MANNTVESVIDNGPFFHGTKAQLNVGDLLVPNRQSNYQDRIMNHIYFTATLEAAKWGAELAVALSNTAEIQDERIYIVEPLGEFENDPNVTDKKFPGNPTRSYRSKAPLKIVGELATWERHSDDVINEMLDGLQQLRATGADIIED
ncbi:NAD(+)--rifampin ADP-ribosyltransferase [Staphylococcus gallinarum]|jgi:rifampin ADP-ribosylating transferase|uniref:NAD(+)--rifampin ADP-ribosyltransferase n=1 Tax=Staphylococcus gallinarum TaxID=1293 RepID=UPI000D1C40D5|nr:NAD(+)--rifampin ADP-ribosyltransferase [Staphylococcus gallinarum]MBU7217160.1 NAD(+)--rifampin ADP-ribosyltransferase [Staphylococcus gallinarum]MCD8794218.1 NAD(+)--rifampin ADP-ribosyltransferase [Staphylococcus gallinarum]MCD8829534.1 NAD(+)--rifampin ADP-ribosyltransferase [Staphylococcus gallinarum]MEB6055482.1 NAD(+)--rifampin ADP-ribosyltransferase [Staphylococcus gallinarum]PTE37056.1 NAD(+)--rifampin ADP-ribosyltransferase [Staphylococcus gallinarum]